MELILSDKMLVKGNPDEIVEFVQKYSDIPRQAEKSTPAYVGEVEEKPRENIASERKHPYSDFGTSVALVLVMKGKTQNWLISEIQQRNPTMYVDSSVLNKVLTGQIVSGKIVDTIKTVLGISG